MPTKSVIFSRPVIATVMASAMAAYVAGRSYSTGLADLYSSGTTRNPSLWLDVDLSSIPYDRAGQSLSPGLLITDRDLIAARHTYNPDDATARAQLTGQVMRFVAMDGTVVSRTISGVGFTNLDHCILNLSASVPASITPAKVLPTNWRTRIEPGVAIPAIYTEQFHRLHIGQWTPTVFSPTVNIASNASYAGYYSTIITGDSGHGCGIVIDGHFVGLGTWHSSPSFSLISDNWANISPLLVGTPSFADLSRFRGVA